MMSKNLGAREQMAELDVSKFKVGDVFYGVTETNNSYFRKKIHREIDGEDWFKYDTPRVTYKIVTYAVLGTLTKHLEGQWDEHSDYDLLSEIFVRSESSEDDVKTYTMYINDMDSKKYFLDKKEAMSYIEQMTEKVRELDKK
jgi:hypothetical protein